MSVIPLQFKIALSPATRSGIAIGAALLLVLAFGSVLMLPAIIAASLAPAMVGPAAILGLVAGVPALRVGVTKLEGILEALGVIGRSHITLCATRIVPPVLFCTR